MFQETQIKQYEQQGFISEPSVLSPAEIDILRQELDRIASEADKHEGVILEKDGRTLRSISNPHLYSEVFDRLIRHPKLLAAVESLIGEKVYTFQLGVNCKAAYSGDIWFWHQDFPTYHHDDHIPEPRMVNTLILIDEASELNGPLMVVPGSHRLPYPKPETSSKGTSYAIRYMDEELVTEQVEQSGLVALKGKPGYVTYMNTNLIHGSSGNLSPWSRRMITLTYNAITNKATHKSSRNASYVPDDRNIPPLEALGNDCLLNIS